MKWLTTLLALYLLALSLWPCADEPQLLNEQAGRVVVNTADRGASHRHEHDECTPFCTCSCCATALSGIPRFNYSLTPPVATAPTSVISFLYTSAHWADPLSAIWQPPKLRV